MTAQDTKLRPGYKQTEVGVIPEDWEVKKVGDILRVRHGKSQHGVVVDDGKYPILATGGEIGRTNDYLSDKPSVLIGRKGTIDTPQYMDTPFWAIDTIFYTEISDGTHPRFVFYLFDMIDWLRYNEASGVPSLNASTIENIEVQCPPVLEQRAIATTLSGVDALIASIDKLIAKKRDIKQATMQQLLTGKTRLPGFSGEWEVRKLGEILQSTNLGGNYTNTETETGLPLIKMGNIGRGKIVLDKVEYIPETCIASEKDMLKYGDVLFNTRNTLDLVGKVAIWKNELPLAYYNSNLMKLQFSPNYVSSNFFVNYVLNTKALLTQLKGIATGTTSVAAIYTRDLLNVIMPIPSQSEQIAIATILSDMDAEITALEQKRDKTRALKQGMMQELLTGKTRLI